MSRVTLPFPLTALLAVMLPPAPLVIETVLAEEDSPVPPTVTEPAAELLSKVTAPVAELELAVRLPPVVTVSPSVPPLVVTEVALRAPLPAVRATLPVAVIVSAVSDPVVVVPVKFVPLPVKLPVI